MNLTGLRGALTPTPLKSFGISRNAAAGRLPSSALGGSGGGFKCDPRAKRPSETQATFCKLLLTKCHIPLSDYLVAANGWVIGFLFHWQQWSCMSGGIVVAGFTEDFTKHFGITHSFLWTAKPAAHSRKNTKPSHKPQKRLLPVLFFFMICPSNMWLLITRVTLSSINCQMGATRANETFKKTYFFLPFID